MGEGVPFVKGDERGMTSHLGNTKLTFRSSKHNADGGDQEHDTSHDAQSIAIPESTRLRSRGKLCAVIVLDLKKINM